jgi:hypothetical protein
MFWSGSSYDGKYAAQQTHAVVPESPTPEYIEELKDALQNTSSITILVHMHRCPACVAFKPEWKKFAKKAQNQTSTIVATPEVYDRLVNQNVFGRVTPNVKRVPEVLLVNKDIPLTARWSKFREIHNATPTHGNLLNFFSFFRNKANEAKDGRQQQDLVNVKEKERQVELELERSRDREVEREKEMEEQMESERVHAKERSQNIQKAKRNSNEINKYRISWS